MNWMPQIKARGVIQNELILHEALHLDATVTAKTGVQNKIERAND
jgi:hypothetical protein